MLQLGKKYIAAFILAFGFIFSAGLKTTASAIDISISPPPIPWFEFQKSQFDLKLGLTYISLSGKSDNSDLSFDGGGLLLTGRYAFNNYFGLDLSSAFMGGGGDIGDAGIGVFIWSGMTNLEIQIVNREKFCFILFLGLNRSYASISVTPYNSYTRSVELWLFGFQGGLQASLKLGYITLSPWFMIQSMSGDVAVDGKETSVDSFTVQTFGIDIVFVPAGITLSGILQNKPKSDNDSQAFILSVSYDFQWGGTRD